MAELEPEMPSDVEGLVVRQQAKRKDIVFVLKYLLSVPDSYERDLKARELYALMFPDYPSELPQFYEDPVAFLVTWYFRNPVQLWPGATQEEMDKEMAEPLVREASLARDRVRMIYGKQWMHWMVVSYAFMTNPKILEVRKGVKKYLQKGDLDLDDRRSILRVLDGDYESILGKMNLSIDSNINKCSSCSNPAQFQCNSCCTRLYCSSRCAKK